MRVDPHVCFCLFLLLVPLPAGAMDEALGAEPPARQGQAARAFQFFPTQLPVTNASPFSTVVAGKGAWHLTSGPSLDATVCRDCSFTSIFETANLSCTNGCIDDHIAVKKWLAGPADVPSALATYQGGLFPFGTHIDTGVPEGLGDLLHAAYTGHGQALLDDSKTSNTWLNDFEDFLFGESGVCSLLENWLATFGPPNAAVKCDPRPSDSKTWLVAYKPNQWRFLAAEFLTPPSPPSQPPAVAEPVFYHPYPFAFYEARERGARSFCAMREAAFAQDAAQKWSMGSEPLGSGAFGLFSAGSSEPQVMVAPPVKLTSSTSANAFAIPLAVRNRISPFRGPILPTMPEKSTPVVWITGDAEVISLEDSGPIVTGHDEQGQPITQVRPRKGYLNGQHFDLFAGRENSGGFDFNAKVPLWGPVFAEVEIGFDFDSGRLVKGFSGKGSLSPWSVAGDGRVLHLPSIHASFEILPPAPRSPLVDRPVGKTTRPWVTPVGGFLATDAPWDAQFLPVDTFVPVELDGLIFGDHLIPAGFGVRTRALMNDDRSLVIMDRTREKFALKVGVGFYFGPLSLEVAGATDAKGEARQFVTLREHASGVGTATLLPHPASTAIDQLGPQTNFVAIPELQSNLSANALTIDATFEIDIKVGLFEFYKKWVTNFLTLGKNDNQIDELFAENRRLRVGEYSDFGFEFDELLPDPSLTFRSVYSHLADPAAADPERFASFPAPPGGDTSSQDVGRCLENSKVPPPPPPPKKGTFGEPPFATCMWGLAGLGTDVDSWKLPANICTGPPGFPQIDLYAEEALTSAGNIFPFLLPITEPKTECLRNVLRFLCDAPPSERKVGPWGYYQNVISRRVELNPKKEPETPDQELLGSLVQLCLDAFIVGPGDPTKQKQGDFVADYLIPRAHACFPDGTLQGDWAP